MLAMNKWFESVKGDRTRPTRKTLTEVMQPFLWESVPYELQYPQARALHGEIVRKFIESLKSDTTSAMNTYLGELLESKLPSDEVQFNHQTKPYEILRFHAPLALLSAALDFNIANPKVSPSARLRGLYISQASLSDLPHELQADLPVPRIVKLAGKGDIYNSSIWLGLEQTYTPLHRDPNPNLFIQMCSTKVVRLLPPPSGEDIYSAMKSHLGTMTGNSRIRGMDMLNGPEAILSLKTIWNDGQWQNEFGPALGNEVARTRATMLEATLDDGDALFIPTGWWHSVRSMHLDGRLNGSVNWWFR